MSGKKDSTRANLRGGAGVAKMVDFRDAKNSDKDNIIADVRDGADAKKMVDFRDIIIANGIDLDQFGAENLDPIVSLVGVEWRL